MCACMCGQGYSCNCGGVAYENKFRILAELFQVGTESVFFLAEN